MNERQLSVGPSVVRGVLLVDCYERPPGMRFDASSLPGHLVQLMRSGVAAHEVGGRQYVLSPGDLIWYHEDERVVGEVLEGPWSFYTVNFVAPTLPPPPFERRVRRAHPGSTSISPACWRHGAMLIGIRSYVSCACSRGCWRCSRMSRKA